MRQIYIVGGAQKEQLQDHNEWHMHRAGLIVRLDPVSRSAEILVEYQSPPELCADDEPSFLFKSSTVVDDKLYTCSSTEVLVYSFPELKLLQHISHPCFNDLHHVNVGPDGRLYIANTGLDMVVELAATGEILRQWCVLEGKDVWHRFSPDVDYRKVVTTKPHVSHPNFAFLLGDDVWATRCKQSDAVCLTRPGQKIQLCDSVPVHDGVVTDKFIYFTRVDAHVVKVDRESLQVAETYRLEDMMSGWRKPGWCRGLHVVDDDHVLVGFTRMRPTKWQGNLNWVKGGMQELRWLYRMPARVSLFNLKERRAVWEISLQDFGMTTIFSIHPIEEAIAQRKAG